ncbi:regulatory protein [Flavobacteriaceae bacterium MAR_2010_188]|nr:regulatory protein [Flavobacteriaceae bacterium MAR_2010_188]
MDSHKYYTLKEAIQKAESYCAYQERCHKEVRQKLFNMKVSSDKIDSVLVHLISHNFLNEERFAETYVRGKFNIKKWGRVRLTAELRRRDISKFIITKALSQISESSYLSTFHELAEKKAESIGEASPIKKKRKLADYLLYRGWESHLVFDKVNDLIGK